MNRPLSAPVGIVQLEATDIQFPCAPGQPVLEAAYTAGIALPYACRRGICGLCAAQVVQGEVKPIDSLPMTNARCDAAQVLLCRCSPSSQRLTVRPVSWERQQPARPLPPL
jgi:ferredoxin